MPLHTSRDASPVHTAAAEEEMTVVREKANAVEFEIGMNDKRTKLKPLPTQLLSRMMHGTNTNKFDFMKNPNAKLSGSISSAGSQSIPSRGSRTISPQSTLSFGETVMDGLEESLKEIRQNAAAEAEKEGSQSHPVERRRKRKATKPHTKPAPQPEQPEEVQPGSQPVAETPEEPVVAAELDILDEKATAVCFDITFSPKAGDSRKAPKGPSAALVERLQQRPSNKSQPGLSPRTPAVKRMGCRGDEDEAGNEDAAMECQSPPRAPPSTRRPRVRRVFGEPALRLAEGEDGICEAPLLSSPTCASPSRGTSLVIGVGVGIEDQPGQALPEPEPLDDDTRQQCEAWVRLLGLHPVKCLHSRHWQHRLEGVRKAMQVIAKYQQAKPEFKDKLFRVFRAIVQMRLADSVMQVYQATVDMARALLAFSRDVPRESVDEAVDQMVPIILRRAGDGNQRICSMAEEFLYWLAACEDVQGFQHVARHVTKPIPDAAKAYKHVIARLKVIAHLVTAHGFQPNRDDGLSAESVNRFTLDVVETVNRRVCQDAAAVVTLLYQKLGLRAIHLLNVQVKDNASEEYLQRALEPLIGELIGELHQERRAKMQASDSLLALAMHEKVGAAFVSRYVQQPPENLFDSAALTGRLELLTRMVAALGFSATGLSVHKVMPFALPGIQSEFEGVRKAASDLVVACHKAAGDEVWQFLVVEDSEAVKELKKRVMVQAKASFRGGGGGSVKARLAADVSIARAQDRTVAFSERR